MEEKGFTLIELLGAIVILGLLALLIVPKAKSAIEDSKKTTAELSAQSLIKIADNYYMEQKSHNVPLHSCEYNFTTNENTCTGIEFTGKKPKSGILKIKATGEVAISINIEKYCLEKQYEEDTVTVTDYDSETCGNIEEN